MDLIVEGKADCAFVDQQVYNRLQRKYKGKIRVIATTEPLPIQPFVYATRLSKSTKDQLISTFMTLHTTRKGRASLDKLGIDHFVRVTDKDYEFLQFVMDTSVGVRRTPSN
jgi:ABC-type phosphate/phosphonate transport system substrate-binding protein